MGGDCPSRPFIKPQKISGQMKCGIRHAKGVVGGQQISDQPDVVDAVDAGYTPQGLAVGEARRVRRVRRVVWCFLVGRRVVGDRDYVRIYG